MPLRPLRWPPYAVSCLTDFVAFLVYFTVSRELAEMRKDLLTMGLIGAIGPVIGSVAFVVCGRLSDRFGRQRMIVGGTLLMMVGPVVVLYWHAYCTAYVLAGVAAAMIFPSVVALMSHGRGGGAGGISRTLILFCLSWNLGMMSAQANGGWLFGIGRQWPLVVAFCFGVVNVLVALLCRKPAPVPAPVAADVAVALDGHQRRRAAAFTRLAWTANLGGAFAIAMIFHLLPKLMVEMNVPPERHGLILAMMRCLVIGVYLLMWCVRFWHFRFWLAAVSQTIAVGGMLLLAHARHESHLWLAVAALGQSTGFNYFASLYYSATGSSDERRASASGIHEATLAFGIAAGSAGGGLIGYLVDIRKPYLLAAGVIAALVCVQVAIYFWHTRPSMRRAAEPA